MHGATQDERLCPLGDRCRPMSGSIGLSSHTSAGVRQATAEVVAGKQWRQVSSDVENLRLVVSHFRRCETSVAEGRGREASVSGTNR